MERQRAANGVDRCGSCGSSDISFDGSWLVCGYCHHRSNTAVLAEELKLSEGIENLVGTSVLTGAKDIDTSSLVTVKCDGCGAVVTINSETTLSATCHWCRHTLSLNHPVDNGAIPDAILPFAITREDATNRVAQYAYERREYASRVFRRDFEKVAVQAVYLPYLVVDGKVTVRLDGQGWVDQGAIDDGKYMTHLAQEFALTREVELLIDDLAIEARSTLTRLYAAVSTTNIINAIQPFDVEHALRFNASYITEGVVFEKRDMEVSSALSYAGDHFATIARGSVNPTLAQYTGGVRWDAEQTVIAGTRWVSMLLPVWLYAFEERTSRGPQMHYIAVNGRSGETEGSVPLNASRATGASLALGLAAAAGVLGCTALAFVINATLGAAIAIAVMPIGLIIALALGLARRDAIAERQRNPLARLVPEDETKHTTTQLVKQDQLRGTLEHQGGPEIKGRNDQFPQVRAAYSRTFLEGIPREEPAQGLTDAGSSPTYLGTAPHPDCSREPRGQLEGTPPPGAPRTAKSSVPTWHSNRHAVRNGDGPRQPS